MRRAPSEPVAAPPALLGVLSHPHEGVWVLLGPAGCGDSAGLGSGCSSDAAGFGGAPRGSVCLHQAPCPEGRLRHLHRQPLPLLLWCQ